MRGVVLGAAALVAFASVRANAAEKRYAQRSDEERRALFEKTRTASSVAERLEEVSAPFVGTIYAHSPLGEGSGYDADPRLRWDKVDCLTFVETSIALAEAPTFDRLLPVLDDVRYGVTPPAFNHRNHFVESEWVPHNLAKGYIRNISREVAGAAAETVSKQFGPELWLKEKKPTGLKLDPQDIPSGTYSLDIVPLEFARKNSQLIPNGTLLMVVRQDRPHVSTRVTHVGFVLEKDGKRFLRHASELPYARVVDEPLDKFFARNAAYAKWPVEGFALFQVEVPATRIEQIAGVTPGTTSQGVPSTSDAISGPRTAHAAQPAPAGGAE